LIAAWTERELLERNEPVGQLSADVWSEVLVNVIGMRPEVWLALLPLLGGAVDQKTHATKAGVFVNYRQQVRLIFFDLLRLLSFGVRLTYYIIALGCRLFRHVSLETSTEEQFKWELTRP
jgi:hypothetical protein